METKNKAHLHPLLWVAVGLSAFAAGLFTAGFIVPPTGVIDNSVLKAGGEIVGMQSIIVLAYGIVSGRTANVTHGKTKISVIGKPKTNKQ